MRAIAVGAWLLLGLALCAMACGGDHSAPTPAPAATPARGLAPAPASAPARATAPALEVAPIGGDATQLDHALDRYQEAVAQARAGEHARAADALLSLLRIDLPTFRSRVERDPALQALRTTPHGARLLAEIARLAPRYARAAAEGVLAYSYTPRPLHAGGVIERSRIPYAGLSAGVYDHRGQRLVPLAPRGANILGAQVDRERRVVLTITGGVHSGTCGHYFIAPERALVFDLDQPGVELLSVAIPFAAAYELPALAARASRDAVHITLLNLDNSRESRSFTLSAQGNVVTKERVGPSVATLLIRGDTGHDHRAWFTSNAQLRPDDGAVLLANDHAIALTAPRHDPIVLLDAQAARGFAATMRTSCSDRAGYDLRITAHLLDLEREAATALDVTAALGLPLVAGRFAADGTFFFQTGTRVTQLAPSAPPEAGSVLPTGIFLTTLLTMPVSPPLCDC